MCWNPVFDKMGLRVTEPERLSMVSGQHPSQAFYNAFADSRTGEYNVAAVGQFLAQAETNAQAQQAWAQLNEQARMEREIAKYLGLIKGGVYVNALEVANGVNAANNTYSGEMGPARNIRRVPDSLIQVKSGDIKAYYNSHKVCSSRLPRVRCRMSCSRLPPRTTICSLSKRALPRWAHSSPLRRS